MRQVMPPSFGPRRCLLTGPAGLVFFAVPDSAMPGIGAAAQDGVNPPGEWRSWGGDAASTRYSPLDQVHAGDFEEFQVAWIWRGDNSSNRLAACSKS